MITTDLRLNIFEKLLFDSTGIYFWKYSKDLKLEYSNCPDSQILCNFFYLDSCYTFLTDYLKQGNSAPLQINSDLSLLWFIVPHYDSDQLVSIYMIGPVFQTRIREAIFREYLQTKNMSLHSGMKLLSIIRNIPISDPFGEFKHLGCMLYSAIYDRKLDVTQIHSQVVSENGILPSPDFSRQMHNSEQSEALILKNVEDGKLGADDLLHSFTLPGTPGSMCPGDPLRQKKDECITFTTLITRAAVKGGYPYEYALSLSDTYIRSMEEAPGISEVEKIFFSCYTDFVEKVHQVKMNFQYSKAVSSLITLIDSCIFSDFSMEDAAHTLGYAKYYLTKCFKKETGLTVSEYLRNQRLETAKELLIHSNEDIVTISNRLRFSLPSYFSQQFRQYVGVSPSDFRDSH